MEIICIQTRVSIQHCTRDSSEMEKIHEEGAWSSHAMLSKPTSNGQSSVTSSQPTANNLHGNPSRFLKNFPSKQTLTLHAFPHEDVNRRSSLGQIGKFLGVIVDGIGSRDSDMS